MSLRSGLVTMNMRSFCFVLRCFVFCFFQVQEFIKTKKWHCNSGDKVHSNSIVCYSCCFLVLLILFRVFASFCFMYMRMDYSLVFSSIICKMKKELMIVSKFLNWISCHHCQCIYICTVYSFFHIINFDDSEFTVETETTKNTIYIHLPTKHQKWKFSKTFLYSKCGMTWTTMWICISMINRLLCHVNSDK